MESTSELIQRLVDSSTADQKLAVLARLHQLSEEQSGGLIIGNVKKLFTELETLISRTEDVTNVPTVQLVSSLACSSDPEITAYTTKLLPSLIVSLRTELPRLCSIVQECLLHYLKKTDNCDAVLIAINKHGIEAAKDLRTQQNAAQVFAALSKAYPSLVDDKKYSTELRRALQGILLAAGYSSGPGRRPFQDALVKLTQTNPSIQRTVRGLDKTLQDEYRKIVAEAGITLSADQSQKGYQDIDSALTEEISKKFCEVALPRIEKSESVSAPRIVGGMAFGVIPERLVKDLNPSANWKQRAGAIEELEEMVNEEKNCAKIEPALPGLFEYLVGLLNDPNYKVSVTTLQIINKLLTFPSVSGVQTLIPGLVEKLGDNKVMIRQLSLQGLRGIGKIMKPQALQALLLPHLSSPKWHTREEILNFIIITFLESGSIDDTFDYRGLLSSILKLLSDDKPKVVQMVYETCATIAHIGSVATVLDILRDLLDRDTFGRLQERIEANNIPTLTPDGGLEFPHIANELTTQNSFFTGQRAGAVSGQSKNGVVGGNQQSRFTSAGPIKKPCEERNIFELHSASKRPQTNNFAAAENRPGNVSPTFGNGMALEPKLEESPAWLADMKKEEEKHEPRNVVKGGGNLKPFSKESSRADSTRANSSESSNAGGRFGDKLKLLKASGLKAPYALNEGKRQQQYSPVDMISEERTTSGGLHRPVAAIVHEPVQEDTQKRCSSLSAKAKIRVPLLAAEHPKAGEETKMYLTPEQILPLEKPEDAWKKALEEMKCTSNWEKQFEACNLLRQVCIHHSDILICSPLQLHGLVQDLLKIVESLRSTLAKNGLFVLSDLFTHGKKSLEPDLELVLNVLLKKGTETGSFLAPPALDAMRAVCENCSEARLVTALLNLTGGAFKASPQVKLRVVTCINTLIRRMGDRIASGKEGEKMMLMLASLLSEGAIEVRNAVKEAFNVASDEVLDPIDFDRLLQRSMNSALYNKLKETLAKGNNRSGIRDESSFSINSSGKKSSPGAVHQQAQSRVLSSKRLKAGAKGVLRGGPLLREKETLKHIASGAPTVLAELKLETSGIGMQGPVPLKLELTKHSLPAKPAMKKLEKQPLKYLTAAEEPTEFENIGIIAANMSSSDWKTRVDAIEALMELSEKNADFLQRSTKFVIVFEALVKGLGDSNGKVSLKAVSVLERFVPLFKTGVEQNVQMLLNGLSNDICSTNATLKNRADTLIDLLIDTVESSCLAQPFVHLALYGNARARPTIVLHLCEILPEIQRTKAGLITKYVYQAAVKLLDDNKTEMRGAVNKLVQALHQLTGAAFVQAVPVGKMEKILAILKAT